MSEWTVATLKEHYDALREADRRLLDERHQAQLRAVDAALLAQEKAVAAALAAQKEQVAAISVSTDKKFESVNEFRGQLKDQASTLLPRAEYESNRRNETTDGFSGRTGSRQIIGLVASWIGTGLALLAAAVAFTR